MPGQGLPAARSLARRRRMLPTSHSRKSSGTRRPHPDGTRSRGTGFVGRRAGLLRGRAENRAGPRRGEQFRGQGPASPGRLDNAESSFRKVIDAVPDDAVAHNNLGRALHDRGLLDSAVSCFQKAIELDPHLLEPWDNLRMALKVGDADESVVSDFGEPVRGSTNHQVFRYSLESFWPHQADDSFDRAMGSLSPMVLRPISAKGLSGKLNAAGLPERVVALFPFGAKRDRASAQLDGQPSPGSQPCPAFTSRGISMLVCGKT